MTKEDIIRMAREAGWQTGTAYDDCRECSNFDPERFADLVAAAVRNQTWTRKHWTDYERAIEAAEREACARLCELKSVSEYFDRPQTPMDCANAIRARGQA